MNLSETLNWIFILSWERYCKDILLSTVLTSISSFVPIHFSFISHLFSFVSLPFLLSFTSVSPFFRHLFLHSFDIHFSFLSTSISPFFRHPFLLSFDIHFSFFRHPFLISFDIYFSFLSPSMDSSMSSTRVSDPYSFQWEYCFKLNSG
jgi:hypothetical protein